MDTSTTIPVPTIKLYKPHEILKLPKEVSTDPRIIPEDPPQVNRLSDRYKGIAAEFVDAYAADDLVLVNAGIGDCTAGYTVGEFAMTVNWFAGQDVIPLYVVPDPTQHVHLPYYVVKGMQPFIDGSKEFLVTMLGVEVREFLTITHGGRAAINMALHASRKVMQQILAELCVEAVDHLRSRVDDPTMQDELVEILTKFVPGIKLQKDGPELPNTEEAEYLAFRIIKLWRQGKQNGQMTNLLFPHMKVQAVGPVPTWGTYPNICLRAIGENSWVELPTTDGLIDPEKLDALCTDNPRIRILLFPNPVNPTGRQYGSDRLAELCRVIAKHKLFWYEDAMYAMFSWRHEHRSVLRAAASIAGSEPDVTKWISAHGFTLAGCMKAGGSGSRVNHMIIPNHNLRSIFVACQGDMYGPPPVFSQMLQYHFIKNGGPDRVWQEMFARRNALQEALESLVAPLKEMGIDLSWTPMEGGFYTLAKFAGVKGRQWTSRKGDLMTIDSGEKFGVFLTEMCGVVISPDLAACIVSEEEVRFAFGTLGLGEIPQMARNLPKGMRKLAA